jgi:hypothetical protein
MNSATGQLLAMSNILLGVVVDDLLQGKVF